MASVMVARSLAGSCAHTCGLLMFGMVGPPGFGYSLEGGHQLRKGSRGQGGGFGVRFR
jgi:hypothetical protein